MACQASVTGWPKQDSKRMVYYNGWEWTIIKVEYIYIYKYWYDHFLRGIDEVNDNDDGVNDTVKNNVF